ncbi:MAG: type III-A CRISPR-associated protein Csm2 [Candidatus Parvarchaeota archaeon]|nr:type III-A CRISPR-associated protein Csm2 [Candidatus Jingweiarchaeum tengchongense]MCW1304936.1 type III-A CRISPR-associated protein Csm2 [Candidatus Jingweiarchaeum tengchongense]MCW1305504.1 type III-A CRISPR-associated protein Csm2 [Candidatus Jingweiarchaeum tengchongense]
MNQNRRTNEELDIEELKKVVFEEDDPEKFLEKLKGIKFEKKTQLRKFFSEVKKAEEEADTEKLKKHIARLIIMLKYAKNKGNIDNNFYTCMNGLLENYLMKNPSKENYEKFIEFLEGVIAFNAEKGE